MADIELGLITALLGTMSAYLLPLALLVLGANSVLVGNKISVWREEV